MPPLFIKLFFCQAVLLFVGRLHEAYLSFTVFLAFFYFRIPLGRRHDFNCNLPVALNNIRRVKDGFDITLIVTVFEEVFLRLYEVLIRLDRLFPFSFTLDDFVLPSLTMLTFCSKISMTI